MIAILTSLTYSLDKISLNTFYSYLSFEGPDMILEQMNFNFDPLDTFVQKLPPLKLLHPTFLFSISFYH